MNVKDCPLILDYPAINALVEKCGGIWDCETCKYGKEGICDYPYIGAVKVGKDNKDR